MNRLSCPKCTFFALLVVLFACDSVRTWDLGVLTSSQMVFLRRQKQLNGSEDKHIIELTAANQLKNMVAVAYDSIKKVTYVSDSNSMLGSIFRINTTRDDAGIEPVVKHDMSIQGMAVDDRTSTLYWTTGSSRTINYLHVPENSTNMLEPERVSTLITFIEEIPQGIAIDSCRGYLYWTNIYHLNASIERVRLNGTDRQKIVSGDLFQPLGVAVDVKLGMLYWSNQQEGGVYYSIECSNLDGSSRKLLTRGTHHQPYSVALDDTYIYWSDWISHTVWSLPRDGRSETPSTVATYSPIAEPMGLMTWFNNSMTVNETHCVVNREQQETADTARETPLKPLHDLCKNNGVLHVSNMTCVCAPGFSGTKCETSVCDGYCAAGECSVDESGRPRCRCPSTSDGTFDDRCVRQQACAKRCQNGGQCVLDSATKEQRCECPADYAGDACQHLSYVRDDICQIYCQHSMPESAHWSFCGCDNKGIGIYKGTSCPLSRSILAVFFILTLFIVSLCTITLVLARKVRTLGRRPRIKKRIVVNKSITPLTSCRPPEQNQQCEITIENCCNMNICETPCFEPDFRPSKQGGKLMLSKGKSKKEDKANLLSNTDMTSSEDEKIVY